jgi:hypothetical protein
MYRQVEDTKVDDDQSVQSANAVTHTVDAESVFSFDSQIDVSTQMPESQLMSGSTTHVSDTTQESFITSGI